MPLLCELVLIDELLLELCELVLIDELLLELDELELDELELEEFELVEMLDELDELLENSVPRSDSNKNIQ